MNTKVAMFSSGVFIFTGLALTASVFGASMGPLATDQAISGPYPARSCIRVQNVDLANAAHVSVVYTPQDGGAAVTEGVDIAPGGFGELCGPTPDLRFRIQLPFIAQQARFGERSAAVFGAWSTLAATEAGGPIFAPIVYDLFGRRYSAVVTADRTIAAVVATRWPTSRGYAVYNLPVPDREVFLTYAAFNVGQMASEIAIQNSDPTQAADATLEVFATGASSPTVVLPLRLGPGASTTVDSRADYRGKGFQGWARVTSSTPVAAVSFLHFGTQSAMVADFEGLPASAGSDRFFAPELRRNRFGTTAVRLLNPSHTSPVTVSLDLVGTSYTPDCQGVRVTQGPIEIAPLSNVVLDQGDLTSPLPDQCIADATLRVAGGSVIATIVARGPSSLGSYSAIPAERAGLEFAMPIYRDRYDRKGVYQTTGFIIFNAGTSAANISIANKDRRGQVLDCGECTKTIPVGWSLASYPPTATGLSTPGNKDGTSRITSDGKIVVFAVVESYEGAPTPIDMAMYSGIRQR